jgi:hypothetical protein
MKDERDMMSELSGSDSSVKSDKDVKTLAVSSVLAPLLFSARIEKTANVRMGDKSGEEKAGVCKPVPARETSQRLTYSHRPDQKLSEFP